MPRRHPSRLIIDTDGGIDDALALILALQSNEEVELVGVSTVSGNVNVEQATLNALRVIELFDQKSIWVAKGAGNPLVRDPVRATSFHGRDGLGDSNLPLPKMRPVNDDAVELLIQQLENEKQGGLTMVCIGPLTNLAELLVKMPEASHRIGQVVMMGGSYGVTKYGIGNVTPVAEFNVYSDPEAAKIVFESGLQLKAVGLDITSVPETWLMPQDYARIRRSKSRLAQFASRILAETMMKRRLFELHDPITVGHTIQPSLYEFEEYVVRVETRGEHTTGMTVTERRMEGEDLWTGNPTTICTNLKSQRFKRFFLSHLTS